MYLCRPDFPEGFLHLQDEYHRSRCHIFTQSFKKFRTRDVAFNHPALPSFVSRLRMTYPTINILHVDASIALSPPTHNCEIRIENSLAVQQPLLSGVRYRCINQIFEGNVLVAQQIVDPKYDVSSCQVDFLAGYWAKKIHGLTQRRQYNKTVVSRELDNITARQDIMIEYTRTNLASEYNLEMQEGRLEPLSAAAHSKRPAQLAMIICWSFCEAGPGKTARTTWCNVNPPPSSTAITASLRSTKAPVFDDLEFHPMLPSQPVTVGRHERLHQQGLESNSSNDSFDHCSIDLETIPSMSSTDGASVSVAGRHEDLTIRAPYQMDEMQALCNTMNDFAQQDPYPTQPTSLGSSYAQLTDAPVYDGPTYLCPTYASSSELHSQTELDPSQVEPSTPLEVPWTSCASSVQFPYQQHLNEYAGMEKLFGEDLTEMHAFLPVSSVGAQDMHETMATMQTALDGSFNVGNNQRPLQLTQTVGREDLSSFHDPSLIDVVRHEDTHDHALALE